MAKEIGFNFLELILKNLIFFVCFCQVEILSFGGENLPFTVYLWILESKERQTHVRTCVRT